MENTFVLKIPTDGSIIDYPGDLVHPQLGEIQYMKETLNIPPNLGEVLKGNVLRIGDVVIKSLEYEDDNLLTCRLTIQAFEYNIGVKFISCVIVKQKGKEKRIFLFTEYEEPIKNDYEIELITEFAKKITDSPLLYHPDFWYKNLCLDKKGNLKAIDWDGSMYSIRRSTITKERAVQFMMDRYHAKLSSGGKRNSKSKRKKTRKKKKK